MDPTSDEGTQAETSVGTPTEVASDTTQTGTADAGTQAVDAHSQAKTDNAQTKEVAGQNPVTAPEGAQKPTGPAWESPENPYYKRFNDTLSHGQRLYQENQTLQQKIQEYKSKQQAEQAKAEQAKLREWNAGHPSHDKFRATQAKMDNYRALLSAAKTPEEQNAVRNLISAQFSPDEIKTLEEAQADNRQLLTRLQSDPRGFMREQVEPMMEEMFGKFQQYLESKQNVQSILQQPDTQQLISQYAEPMHRMMDPNLPGREKAFAYAQALREIDQLKAKLSQDLETKATAQAQQTVLNKRSGSVNRRPSIDRESIGDPVEYLTKKGIPPGHPKFAEELLKINNN